MVKVIKFFIRLPVVLGITVLTPISFIIVWACSDWSLKKTFEELIDYIKISWVRGPFE